MKEFLDKLAQISKSADYEKTLALLKALKDGSVTLDQVQLVEGGWAFVSVPQVAAIEEAATPQEEKKDEQATPLEQAPLVEQAQQQ